MASGTQSLPVLRRDAVAPAVPANAADELVPWIPRTAAYWSARRDAVLKELVEEWRTSPDAARWPDVDRLIERLRQGPMEMVRQLPAAARAAMALCDDEYLPRKSLSDKLAQDPSLVSSLLKQANSSLIGGGLDSVVSVDGAIDRIGVGGTRAVVVATSIEGLLSKPGPPYESIAHGIWTHMVATAPIAGVFAWPSVSGPTKRLRPPCCMTSASWSSLTRFRPSASSCDEPSNCRRHG